MTDRLLKQLMQSHPERYDPAVVMIEPAPVRKPQQLDLPLDMPKVRRARKSAIFGSPQITAIQRIVSAFYDTDPGFMTTIVATKDATFSRRVAMYIAKNLTGVSLYTIGDQFGGYDHSTVVHNIKKIKERLCWDSPFRDEVEFLTNKCRAAA